MEYAEQYEDQSCHDGGDCQSFQSVILNDAVHDDDECTGRSADLYAVTAEERYDETSDDRRDQTFFGRYSGCYTECDGKRQGYDTDNDTRHQVGDQFFLRVVFERRECFRMKFEICFHFYIYYVMNPVISGFSLSVRQPVSSIKECV